MKGGWVLRTGYIVGVAYDSPDCVRKNGEERFKKGSL